RRSDYYGHTWTHGCATHPVGECGGKSCPSRTLSSPDCETARAEGVRTYGHRYPTCRREDTPGARRATRLVPEPAIPWFITPSPGHWPRPDVPPARGLPRPVPGGWRGLLQRPGAARRLDHGSGQRLWRGPRGRAG